MALRAEDLQLIHGGALGPEALVPLRAGPLAPAALTLVPSRQNSADFERVDFASIKRNTDYVTRATTRVLSNLVARSVWRVLGDPTRLAELLDQDVADIGTLEFAPGDQRRLREACQQALAAGWVVGITQARRESRKVVAETPQSELEFHLPGQHDQQSHAGEDARNAAGAEVKVKDAYHGTVDVFLRSIKKKGILPSFATGRMNYGGAPELYDGDRGMSVFVAQNESRAWHWAQTLASSTGGTALPVVIHARIPVEEWQKRARPDDISDWESGEVTGDTMFVGSRIMPEWIAGYYDYLGDNSEPAYHKFSVAAPGFIDLYIAAVVVEDAERAEFHLPGQHDQEDHGNRGGGIGTTGGRSQELAGDVRWSPAQWRALPMGERRKAWGELSKSERDELADPKTSIDERADVHLGDADREYPDTGTAAGDIKAYVEELSSVTTTAVRQKLTEYGNSVHEQLTAAGVKPEEARALALDMTRLIAAQDVEAAGRTLGDHGAHHILQDQKLALETLSQVPGLELSPDRAAALSLAVALHDSGYLTPPSGEFLDADHGRWSAQYYMEHYYDRVEAALGKENAEFVAQAIAAHDSTVVDWETQPELSAIALADNLALFHAEKMPPMLRYVPANMKPLIALGQGRISLDTAKNMMRRNVERSDLSPTLKLRMLAGIEEVSPALPKFTVGMVGAKLAGVEWSEDHPVFRIERHASNEALSKVLDMGQQQFRKLADTYHKDPAEFLRTGRLRAEENGHVLFEATIERAGRGQMARDFDAWLAFHLPGQHDQASHAGDDARNEAGAEAPIDVYHGTLDTALAGIKKDGLRVGGSRGAAFVARSYSAAAEWATSAMRRFLVRGTGARLPEPVIIHARIPRDVWAAHAKPDRVGGTGRDFALDIPVLPEWLVGYYARGGAKMAFAAEPEGEDVYLVVFVEPERADDFSRRLAFATDLREVAADYFEANGFRMAQNLSDGARALIQQELMRAVRTGETGSAVSGRIYRRLIERGFTDLEGVETEVDDEYVLADLLDLDSPDAVPAYLNTLVRTNVFEAMNEARYAEFTDPALDGYVRAFEYSAILDENTTDFCRYMDGKIYAADNPIWDTHRPPNHYNCRSILIPLTQLSNWDGEESEPPAVEPAVGFARCGCAVHAYETEPGHGRSLADHRHTIFGIPGEANDRARFHLPGGHDQQSHAGGAQRDAVEPHDATGGREGPVILQVDISTTGQPAYVTGWGSWGVAYKTMDPARAKQFKDKAAAVAWLRARHAVQEDDLREAAVHSATLPAEELNAAAQALIERSKFAWDPAQARWPAGTPISGEQGGGRWMEVGNKAGDKQGYWYDRSRNYETLANLTKAEGDALHAYRQNSADINKPLRRGKERVPVELESAWHTVSDAGDLLEEKRYKDVLSLMSEDDQETFGQLRQQVLDDLKEQKRLERAMDKQQDRAVKMLEDWKREFRGPRQRESEEAVAKSKLIDAAFDKADELSGKAYRLEERAADRTDDIIEMLDKAAEADAVKLIDSALKKATFPRNAVLFRGVRASHLPKNLRVGSTVKDAGYGSWSVDMEAAREFGGGKTVMVTGISKGDHAIALRHSGSNWNSEREVMLPRDQRYRVTAIHTVDFADQADQEDFGDHDKVKIIVVAPVKRKGH